MTYDEKWKQALIDSKIFTDFDENTDINKCIAIYLNTVNSVYLIISDMGLQCDAIGFKTLNEVQTDPLLKSLNTSILTIYYSYNGQSRVIINYPLKSIIPSLTITDEERLHMILDFKSNLFNNFQKNGRRIWPNDEASWAELSFKILKTMGITKDDITKV